jgi:NAD-dependent SIR2 family protein deacetylase
MTREPVLEAEAPISSAVDGTDRLSEFLLRHRRVFVLTGAGCSTGSGIPDYRDADGRWKRGSPVQYRDFLRHEHIRRRYWARSLVGWPHFARAEPGPAHRALARLERAGRISQIVTQNVDGLHQRAGSRRVLDLHGRLDRVDCLDCGHRVEREALQASLVAVNPELAEIVAGIRPDGDAELDGLDLERMRVPDCPCCGGLLKPAVVFFGESVPQPRVRRAFERLRESEALLVVGSSLMVFSGYRFCREAARLGLPVAALNLGRTRADAELSLKLVGDCGRLLPGIAERVLAELPADRRG